MPIRLLHEAQRLKLIPLAGLGLVILYLAAFLPLKHRVQALNRPLDAQWRDLATALNETNLDRRVDFVGIEEQLRETQESLIALQTVASKAASRVDLGPDTRAVLAAPFQLVDYQDERQKVLEELGTLATQRAVSLSPAVTNGLPEYSTDLPHPPLLWAELAMVRHLLAVAINCQVTAIHSVGVPAALRPAPRTNRSLRLHEIRIQTELTGSAGSVARLLQSLPLRAEEIKAKSLPEALTNKPALFIDRLLVLRQSPEKPDEVRLSLRASGFVFLPESLVAAGWKAAIP